VVADPITAQVKTVPYIKVLPIVTLANTRPVPLGIVTSSKVIYAISPTLVAYNVVVAEAVPRVNVTAMLAVVIDSLVYVDDACAWSILVATPLLIPKDPRVVLLGICILSTHT